METLEEILSRQKDGLIKRAGGEVLPVSSGTLTVVQNKLGGEDSARKRPAAPGVDLIITIDASPSRNLAQFNAEKHLLLSAIQTVSSPSLRVSIIRFYRSAEVIVGLDDHVSADAYTGIFDNLTLISNASTTNDKGVQREHNARSMGR
jgi:hypothetical protein